MKRKISDWTGVEVKGQYAAVFAWNTSDLNLINVKALFSIYISLLLFLVNTYCSSKVA